MNKMLYPPIRSYVLRQGRLTPAQRRALEECWPQYGLEYDKQFINFEEIFGRQASCVLEIGFGNGQSLLKQAAAYPRIDFIGIEVHLPGVGSLLAELKKQTLSNVRVFKHDAVEVLRDCIPDRALDGVQIFFPDPWPKKRHHKRRLIQTSLVTLLTRKLKVGGYLHCATDWEDYAQYIMEVLSCSDLVNIAGESKYCTNTLRPLTKFEGRGLRLGHNVRELIFKNFV